VGRDGAVPRDTKHGDFEKSAKKIYIYTHTYIYIYVYRFVYIFMYIYIQGVPEGMLNNSGECSLC